MLQASDFPILEYDSDKDAVIRPELWVEKADVANRCVICFFSEAIKNVVEKLPSRVVGHISSECAVMPVYEVDYKGQKLCLVQAFVGAPLAAGQLEELAVMGCGSFVVCGSCGVLEKDMALGHLIIPSSAVRDEGTSYHYAPPSREIKANGRMTELIKETLRESGLPFVVGKTWTTDAFYRETKAKVALRKKEGCIVVEMEASAFFAVAEYLGVDLGLILYGGDNLGGEEWDSRGFNKQVSTREHLLFTALDVALKIER